MTNPPPVGPVEGHYALLRNGEAVGPINKYAKQPYLFTARLPHMSWRADGVSDWDDSDYDIIATISPADMQAVASGEPERLRAALNDIFEMWAGSEGFIPHTAPEGYLLMLVKKMADRAALAKQGGAS